MDLTTVLLFLIGAAIIWYQILSSLRRSGNSVEAQIRNQKKREQFLGEMRKLQKELEDAKAAYNNAKRDALKSNSERTE